jgi:hypothetical protein
MSFAEPASASGIDYQELNGHLLIVDVSEVIPEITTSFGVNDAVRATIVDLDDNNNTYTDTLIFPKVLKAQLRPNVGRKVLGRLGQGQAKPSQSPPWTLQTATDADKKLAGDYLATQLTADDL